MYTHTYCTWPVAKPSGQPVLKRQIFAPTALKPSGRALKRADGFKMVPNIQCIHESVAYMYCTHTCVCVQPTDGGCDCSLGERGIPSAHSARERGERQATRATTAQVERCCLRQSTGECKILHTHIVLYVR